MNDSTTPPTTDNAQLEGKQEAWHTLPLDAVTQRLQTDATRGLTNAETSRR